MKKQGKFIEKMMAIMISTVIILGCYTKVFATEGAVLPAESEEQDILLVELPVMTDDKGSIFDFILDPQGLINKTNAAGYGGRTFEEGATLYFENANGKYDFSRYSDQLSIKNKSSVPVKVTVTAELENLGEIQIVEDDDFANEADASLFLAVVDSEGIVFPIDEEGCISISKVIAPDTAYTSQDDEAIQAYLDELEESAQYIGEDTYSFGLTGACNPYGNWADLAFNPVVTVTWKMEPIDVEEQEIDSNTETIETYVSGNDAEGAL